MINVKNEVINVINNVINLKFKVINVINGVINLINKVINIKNGVKNLKIVVLGRISLLTRCAAARAGEEIY